jgi:hypothetical protein
VARARTLEQIAEDVRAEVQSYVPPPPHPLQLGTPLPVEWYEQQLSEMRTALVEPYVLEVLGDGRETEEHARSVVIVAEDAEVLLAYDPDPEGDFALIFRQAARLILSPVRGDAVDCFLSR